MPGNVVNFDFYSGERKVEGKHSQEKCSGLASVSEEEELEDNDEEKARIEANMQRFLQRKTFNLRDQTRDRVDTMLNEYLGYFSAHYTAVNCDVKPAVVPTGAYEAVPTTVSMQVLNGRSVLFQLVEIGDRRDDELQFRFGDA